jgi:hypothetical protein
MKLKSYKTIQALYIVVSASALLTACFPRSASEPMKLLSGSSQGSQQILISPESLSAGNNYGVTPAGDVVFSIDSEKVVTDLTY